MTQKKQPKPGIAALIAKHGLHKVASTHPAIQSSLEEALTLDSSVESEDLDHCAPGFGRNNYGRGGCVVQ